MSDPSGLPDPWSRLAEAQERSDTFKAALDAAARSIHEAVAQAQAAIQRELVLLHSDVHGGEEGESRDFGASAKEASAAFAQASRQVQLAAEVYENADSTDQAAPPHVPGIPPNAGLDPLGDADELMRHATDSLNEAMSRLVTSSRRGESGRST